MVASQNYNQIHVQEQFINQFNQDGQDEQQGQALELSPIQLLDLLNNSRIDEILDNLNTIMEYFSEQYLPWQIFELSVTMEKLENINNLSSEEYAKLAMLFESTIIHNEFICFYDLEPENNSYAIADIIHTFDENFWNGQGNLRDYYTDMINTFRNAYGQNRVDSIME